MSKEVDLIGQRHGRLVCVEYLGLQKRGDGRNNKMWKCVCDCGNEKIVTTNSFKSSMSCGCYKKDVIHDLRYKGDDSKRLYGIYRQMKLRCYDSSSKHYKNYGLRGIRICGEWLGDDGLDNFRKWAIESGYHKGLTIDRRDNNKDYSPDNCRWVDMKIQSNNKRNNVWLEMNGKTQTLTQWCEEYNVPYPRVRVRIRNMGWTLQEALTTPIYQERR